MTPIDYALAGLCVGSLATSLGLGVLGLLRAEKVAARYARREARKVVGNDIHQLLGKCRLLEIDVLKVSGDVRHVRHAAEQHGLIRGPHVLPVRPNGSSQQVG